MEEADPTDLDPLNPGYRSPRSSGGSEGVENETGGALASLFIFPIRPRRRAELGTGPFDTHPALAFGSRIQTASVESGLANLIPSKQNPDNVAMVWAHGCGGSACSDTIKSIGRQDISAALCNSVQSDLGSWSFPDRRLLIVGPADQSGPPPRAKPQWTSRGNVSTLGSLACLTVPVRRAQGYFRIRDCFRRSGDRPHGALDLRSNPERQFRFRFTRARFRIGEQKNQAPVNYRSAAGTKCTETPKTGVQ